MLFGKITGVYFKKCVRDINTLYDNLRGFLPLQLAAGHIITPGVKAVILFLFSH